MLPIVVPFTDRLHEVTPTASVKVELILTEDPAVTVAGPGRPTTGAVVSVVTALAVI